MGGNNANSIERERAPEMVSTYHKPWHETHKRQSGPVGERVSENDVVIRTSHRHERDERRQVGQELYALQAALHTGHCVHGHLGVSALGVRSAASCADGVGGVEEGGGGRQRRGMRKGGFARRRRRRRSDGRRNLSLSERVEELGLGRRARRWDSELS